MYLIAIGWLYVALMYAIFDDTLLGGILTFLFYGLAPLALLLWLLGTPARRQRQRQNEAAGASHNDRAETPPDQ